jgi:class 3 adenylate cyclase
MFCDLVGSTALSARFDLEDLRAVIGAYHRCCAAVERSGGFVAKYMGDGVLAYFGYPRADEHDAERAVLSEFHEPLIRYRAVIGDGAMPEKSQTRRCPRSVNRGRRRVSTSCGGR